MANEMQLAGIWARHLPGLAAITTDAKRDWRSSAIDGQLRDQLLSNKRLERRIFEDIVATAIGEDSGTEAIGTRDSDLEHVLSSDLELVEKRSGLVWFASLLGTPDAVGRILRSCPMIGIEDVRFALSVQYRGAAEFDPNVEVADDISANGRACISAWLNRLPKQFTGILAVLEHPVGEIYREKVDSTERAAAFDACLQALGSRS